MKIRYAAVLFIVVAAVSCCGLPAFCSTDRTVSVSASAEKPLTPGPALDDFDSGKRLNLWNCATGVFKKSGSAANCTDSFTDAAGAYGGTGKSLKLDYNVSETDSYAGYYSQMKTIDGSAGSIGPYSRVSFYVRGAVGGEFFKIQLKNTSTALYGPTSGTHYRRNMASVYITDYLDGGVTTSWKPVTIPLKNFANLDGFTAMAEFEIVFENSQSSTNGSATSGTVYIDNIAFETTAVSALRIDHYGDKIGLCAMGGAMGAGGSGGASLSFSFSSAAGQYYDYANGLKLVYNVPTWQYAYMFTVFGGGNDDGAGGIEDSSKMGWIPVEQDLGAYTSLHLRVKGKSGGNPYIMKIELVDRNGAKWREIAGITTTGFQSYTLPFTDFEDPSSGQHNLDKSSIKQINFVLEGNRIYQYSGNQSGEVYIDEVQFQ